MIIVRDRKRNDPPPGLMRYFSSVLFIDKSLIELWWWWCGLTVQGVVVLTDNDQGNVVFFGWLLLISVLSGVLEGCTGFGRTSLRSYKID